MDKAIKEFVLKNEKLEIRFINIGGAITHILMPDKNGCIENITLAHKNLHDYIIAEPNYIGTLVGRIAGRVPYGKIKIDNKEYSLSINNNGHSLHGGISGFSMKAWDVEKIDDNKYSLKYFSEDGEEGYPGNLKITVTYTLKDNELIIEYYGTTDKPTAINMTNHAYFNLSGGKELAQSHELWLNSSSYLEANELLMATGKLIPSKDTFMDFSAKKSIGKDFPENGYDNCVYLNEDRSLTEPVAILSHEESKRELVIFTDQPAVVLYTDGSAEGSGETNYGKRQKFSGVCLETQKPNLGADGTFTEMYELKANEAYTQKTIYQFNLI